MSLRAPRKGENYELSVDLNSGYADKRKDAIKRVIASMTVGKGALTVPADSGVLDAPLRCQRPLPRRPQEHANR